jgi:hypothetical protein
LTCPEKARKKREHLAYRVKNSENPSGIQNGKLVHHAILYELFSLRLFKDPWCHAYSMD